MMLRQLIERGIYHFSVALEAALHVRHFLRTLVYEQDDHLDVRVVFFYAVRDLLDKHGLSGLRRCDDQASLAFAYRRHKVYQSQRKVPAVLQLEPLVREYRRERLEIRSLHRNARLVAVHRHHVKQRAEFIAVVRVSAYSFYFITCLEVETPDLCRRNVYIFFTGKEIIESQESESAVRKLEYALYLESVASVRRRPASVPAGSLRSVIMPVICSAVCPAVCMCACCCMSASGC